MTDLLRRILIVVILAGLAVATGWLVGAAARSGASVGLIEMDGGLTGRMQDSGAVIAHECSQECSNPDPRPATPDPGSIPRIDAGRADELGRPITVSCASCHASLPPNHALRDAADLTDFHVGLRYEHGGMTCLSCHHPDDYNSLRLVDGRRVEFAQVQQMCAQCHAPQARDFERGAHGGMTGFWDLSRGERIRKSCIDCHDPHHPAFPPMVPTFKPYDRFLPTPEAAEH